jgi:hypothetical protein
MNYQNKSKEDQLANNKSSKQPSVPTYSNGKTTVAKPKPPTAEELRIQAEQQERQRQADLKNAEERKEQQRLAAIERENQRIEQERLAEVLRQEKLQAFNLGNKYAADVLSKQKLEMNVYYTVLSQIKEQISNTSNNSNSYDSKNYEIYNTYTKQAKTEGYAVGVEKAKVLAQAEAKKSVEEIILQNINMNSNITQPTTTSASYIGTENPIRLTTIEQYVMEKWNNSKSSASAIQLLGNERSRYFENIDSDLFQIATSNSNLRIALIEKATGISSNGNGVLRLWSKDKGQYSYEANQLQIENRNELQSSFKDGFAQGMKQISFEYDSIAGSATRIIFDKLKEDWVKNQVMLYKAYETSYKDSTLDGFQTAYSSAFKAEFDKTSASLSKISKLIVQSFKILINEKDITNNGEILVGIGETLGLEFRAINIGGMTLNTKLELNSVPLSIQNTTSRSINIGSKQALNMHLTDIARISTGDSNSVLLNETYPILFTAQDFQKSINITIDWEKTFNVLAKTDTPIEVRQQILGFITKKLSNEWSKFTGKVVHNYYSYPENAEKSFLGVIPSFLTKKPGLCVNNDKAALKLAIKNAFPESRPYFELRFFDYNTTQEIIQDIDTLIDNNCQTSSAN